MKWFMIAAMAVSFLFGGMAFAQEDNFDLDALLGDMDSAAAPAEAGAPAAADAAVAPAAAEEVAAPAEEAVVEEAAPVADAPAPPPAPEFNG